jgi:hypothetical protein
MDFAPAGSAQAPLAAVPSASRREIHDFFLAGDAASAALSQLWRGVHRSSPDFGHDRTPSMHDTGET